MGSSPVTNAELLATLREVRVMLENVLRRLDEEDAPPKPTLQVLTGKGADGA